MEATQENTNAPDEPKPDDKVAELETPLNASTSGQYKGSLAYHTLRSRLPGILANVKETLTREKTELVSLYAPSDFEQAARDELNVIKSMISGLKYDLLTDQPLRGFTRPEVLDRDVWNKFIRSLPKDEDTFHRGCCLDAECYFHRRLYSFVEGSVFFKHYDFFAKIKEQALTGSMDDVLALVKHTRRSARDPEVFADLLKINVWSNYNDDDKELPSRRVLEEVAACDAYVLVNQAPEIWRCLDHTHTHHPATKQAQAPVDFIVDNAGYELFTDFILAEYMIEKGLATKVRFHVKAHPWFVTDVTEQDFRWTLQYLCRHEHYLISLVGKKFVQFLDEKKFELAPISRFWTSPHAFPAMVRADPELYGSLKCSKLVVFKGELNYRKLLQDVCRESTQEVRACLGGFLPSNICVLRRIKSEIICGLAEGVAQSLTLKDPHWMMSGSYGIIQFVKAARELGV